MSDYMAVGLAFMLFTYIVGVGAWLCWRVLAKHLREHVTDDSEKGGTAG